MNWTRALVGGLLSELLVLALIMPVALGVGLDSLGDPANVPPLLGDSIVVASFVAPLLLAQWVARRVSGESQPPIYWAAHAAKILGGVAGGQVNCAGLRLVLGGQTGRAIVERTGQPTFGDVQERTGRLQSAFLAGGDHLGHARLRTLVGQEREEVRRLQLDGLIRVVQALREDGEELLVFASARRLGPPVGDGEIAD